MIIFNIISINFLTNIIIKIFYLIIIFRNSLKYMEKENTKNNSFSSSIQAHKCKTSTKSLFYPKRNEDKLKITAKLNLYHQRDKKFLNFTSSNILNESRISYLQDKKICRICFEKETSKNILITPCLCEGKVKYVHQICLKNLFIHKKIKPEFAKCEKCYYHYYIRFYNDIKFDKELCKKFILFLLMLILGLILCFGLLIVFLFKFIFIKQKKNSDKLLIWSILVSLFIIIVICLIIIFCNYKSKRIFFKNFEVLNYNKNKFNNSSTLSLNLSKNTLFPSKNKINNYIFNNNFVK